MKQGVGRFSISLHKIRSCFYITVVSIFVYNNKVYIKTVSSFMKSYDRS